MNWLSCQMLKKIHLGRMVLTKSHRSVNIDTASWCRASVTPAGWTARMHDWSWTRRAPSNTHKFFAVHLSASTHVNVYVSSTTSSIQTVNHRSTQTGAYQPPCPATWVWSRWIVAAAEWICILSVEGSKSAILNVICAKS